MEFKRHLKPQMMDGKYGLHGKLKATVGNGEKLASILVEASKVVANAKGCQIYIVSKDHDDQDSIWVTEAWDSKADHDNSLNDARVKALIAEAVPLLDGKPEKGHEFEIVGGLGIT